jgi:hypothetical protein
MDKRKALGRDPFLSWIKRTQNGREQNAAAEPPVSSTSDSSPSEAESVMSADETKYQPVAKEPPASRQTAPARSWPFVTIIACDMLLLLFLGYLAYADLGERLSLANKKIERMTAEMNLLRDEVVQLKRGQELDQIAPSRGSSNTSRPAPRR